MQISLKHHKRLSSSSLVCLLGILLSAAHPYVIRKLNYPRRSERSGLAIGVVALQVILGVLTILSYVNYYRALIHQANALVLFGLAIFFIHRFRALDHLTG